MSKVWPDGTTFTRPTWHFHRNLFERHNGRSLQPGEYPRICELIKQNVLRPLKIPERKKTYNRLYFYQPKKHGFKGDALYIVAEPDGKGLISVYKKDWVEIRLESARLKAHST